MKNLFFAVLPLFIFSGAVAQTGMVAQPEATAFYNKAMAAARPQIKTLVNTTARQLTGHSVSVDSLRIAIKNKPQAAGLGNRDIDALMMMVLMQINNDAQKDLSNQMDEIKRLNNVKKAQRDKINKMKAQQDSLKNKTVAEYEAVKKAGKIAPTLSLIDYQKQRGIDFPILSLNNSKDTPADVSEQQQLKMQQTMDRMSKAETVVSNLMKSISDSENDIINNFK